MWEGVDLHVFLEKQLQLWGFEGLPLLLPQRIPRQTPAQASLPRPCICLVAKWLFAPLSPHGIHLLGALHPQPRFHLFVSQHIVSSSPCARVEGSHPARPRSGIGSEWMIGSGHLCQGFGMLRSRSPVLMNVIYTYQMCHWVTCQIFYIMPFCRTRDSWGRECLLMPWGGSEHGFFFFLIRTSRHHPYTQSVPPHWAKTYGWGHLPQRQPGSRRAGVRWLSPAFVAFLLPWVSSPRPHPNLGQRIF